jgi:hypothetical protein
MANEQMKQQRPVMTALSRRHVGDNQEAAHE